MTNKTSFKKGFFALYIAVGLYVAVMYLLCASRGEQRSYDIMSSLSLSFGLFSGIAFVETDKSKHWFVPVSLGLLWVAGVVIDYVYSSNHGEWGQKSLLRDSIFLLLFYVPLLAIWALSRIKKGKNVIQAFVSAVFALFSLGFLPGRGVLEPLYDLLLVVLSMVTFAIVAQSQSRRQRLLSLLVFLAVYSYTIIASFPLNLAMFVIVATALLMVWGILSAAWKDKTKKVIFVVLACLMSTFAVFAIPSWSTFAFNRFYYPEQVIPVEKSVKFESAFVTPENDAISLESLQGKTVVLFFWTASCGYCHVMMPDFSAFAKSYASDPNIVFYAVFFGEKEDELNHYEEMINNDYAFQWARALDDKEVMEKLGFNGFPHLTIVSSNGTVVYNGLVDFHPTSIYYPRRYLKRQIH